MNNFVLPADALGAATEEAYLEVRRAKAKHPGEFKSFHEGYGVLLEEVDELWDEIKMNTHDRTSIREEAIQVAAMALRIAAELTPVPSK